MSETDLKKISALQLLAYLSEKTRLAIFRDLNKTREASFTKAPEVGSDVSDFRNDEALKLLEALEEEQAKRPIKENRMLD